MLYPDTVLGIAAVYPRFPFYLLASDIYFSGVKNLTALGNLIKWQKVSYDFKYHQQDFPADVPVLALSEGKSLLPVSVLAYDIHTCTCIYISNMVATNW